MKLRFAWAMILALVASACSGSTDITGSNSSRARVAEEDLVELVAKARCDQEMACDCYALSGPVGEDPEEYTYQTCLENRRLELSHWQASMRDAGLRYDGACLARHLERAASWGCDDRTRAWDDLSCDARCRVYHGTLDEGETCTPGSLACDRGLACTYDPTAGGLDGGYTCRSTCASPGESCSYETCAPGSYCSDSGICVSLPTEGDSCADSYQCAIGSECDFSSGNQAYCVARLADGESCGPSDYCLGTCVEGICEPGRPAICGWDVRMP